MSGLGDALSGGDPSKLDAPMLPEYVKHSCTKDKFTIDFYSDKDCKTDLKMGGETTWGACNVFSIMGLKRSFTVAGANFLKASLAAMIALFATQF